MPAPTRVPDNANISDPSDPYYSSTPGYAWNGNGWVWKDDGDTSDSRGSQLGNPSISAETTGTSMDPTAAVIIGGATGFFPMALGGGIAGLDQTSAAGDALAGGNPFQYTDEYFNNAGLMDTWQNYFDSYGGSARPGHIGLDQTNQNQSRDWQQQIIQDLQKQAAGDMDSRAQQSLRSGYDAASRQQMALGSSLRGTGGGAGLRAGARGAAGVSRGQAGAQQMLLLQEQQSAQALLAQMLAQQRAQDAAGANDYAQNWLANNQTQSDWVNWLNQQGLGLALEGQQQRSELGRAILGTDVSNRDFAQRAAGQAAQAGAGMFGAMSQQGGGGGSGSSGGSSGGGSSQQTIDDAFNSNPWDDELNY